MNDSAAVGESGMTEKGAEAPNAMKTLFSVILCTHNPRQDYLRRTLPVGVWRGLTGAVRGRGLTGAVHAGVIMVGVAAAGYGALVESLRRPVAPAPTAEVPA